MPKSSTAPAFAAPAPAAPALAASVVAVLKSSSPQRAVPRCDELGSGAGVGPDERFASRVQHTEEPTLSTVQLVTLSPSSNAAGARVAGPSPTEDGDGASAAAPGVGSGTGVAGKAVVGNVVAKAIGGLPVGLMVRPAVGEADDAVREVVVGIVVGDNDVKGGAADGLATGVVNSGKVGAADGRDVGIDDGSCDGCGDD